MNKASFRMYSKAVFPYLCILGVSFQLDLKTGIDGKIDSHGKELW